MPERLANASPPCPPWLVDLARLELFCHRTSLTSIPPPETLDQLCLNPSLQLIRLTWRNLLPLLTDTGQANLARVTTGDEVILAWRDPLTGALRTGLALPARLLPIKLVTEGISVETAAAEGGVTVATIDELVRAGIRDGILLTPPSRLKRETDQKATDVFTLQWHLTQSCDLACKHCYDRSSRADFPFERALTLIQELRDFCSSHFVRPQVTFTGGNPLLHPRFFDLYQAAADHGMLVAILGNATSRANLERMVAILRPVYYQVSLEGLEQHNDEIRGTGNYRRTIAFLQLLTELGIPNLVMLTLTKANLQQVLPLAEQLEGITGALAFNRLALFGEGARLAQPDTVEYQDFLHRYVEAMPTHPVLALKDNLLNSVLDEQGRPVFGGCTGSGCGAAFNFLSILSDGEVHACRKFPSPIGNILHQQLEPLYNSDKALAYRSGSSACNGCSLRAVCGGCLAITASHGLDPFSCKDPYCTRPI